MIYEGSPGPNGLCEDSGRIANTMLTGQSTRGYQLTLMGKVEFQASGSRRQFLSTVAMRAGAATLLRPRSGRAADITDPRVADIVAKTIKTQCTQLPGLHQEAPALRGATHNRQRRVRNSRGRWIAELQIHDH